jgi:hypothetical protein
MRANRPPSLNGDGSPIQINRPGRTKSRILDWEHDSTSTARVARHNRHTPGREILDGKM